MTIRFPIRSHMWFTKPRESRTTRTVTRLPTVTREECMGCEWFKRWTIPNSEGRCTHKGLGCYRSPMRLDPWTKPVVCPLSSVVTRKNLATDSGRPAKRPNIWTVATSEFRSRTFG